MRKLFCLVLVSMLLLSGCAISKDSLSDKDTGLNQDYSDLLDDFFADDDTKATNSNTETTSPVKNEQSKPAGSQAGISVSKQNALKSAQSYLRYSAFSYQGLIDQLEYEGYPKEDCVYAVDNCGADWFEQAVKCAESYLKYSSFSYSELVDQLEYEGFTHEQAKHGADKAYGESSSGISVSKQNALKSAQSYLRYSAFSYQGLIDQLEYEGYPKEDCVYAVDNCGADWFEQAVKCAESYLKYSSFSYSELVDQLEYEGFTHEQAVYGAKQNGL